MEKEKQYRIFFVVITITLILGITGGYFLFSDSSGFGADHREEEMQELPEGLLEGVISEINFSESHIVIDVDNPEELSGQLIEMKMDEGTDFEELKLKVYGLGDVEPAGREVISGENIRKGDEVLVSIGRDILRAVDDDREIVARGITVITAEEAN